MSPDTRRGFTLLEVLVAMLVLSVALLAALELFGGGLRLVRAAADHVGATLVASARLAEVGPGPLEDEETEGTEGAYRWVRTVTVEPALRPVIPASPDQDHVRMARVRVRVTWGPGQPEGRAVELTTLRAWGVRP